MQKEEITRQTILIVDDSQLNRLLLSKILSDQYEILEAENGVQALEQLEKNAESISLVLLDIVMPELDGFEVLERKNRSSRTESIPVIMISAANTPDMIDRAFSFGVADFINRPFVPALVRHCITKTLALYDQQQQLANMVAEQICQREKDSGMMISILSHIVEFRNGESSLHIQHIRVITEMLLKDLVRKKNDLPLQAQDIFRISTAAALHDIGKIAVPMEVLNKPGRLTADEFAIMKQHAATGAEMLRGLMGQYDAPLLKTGYEICRWHHERYDGRGYPDGLAGDEIPLSAQVVSIADVYDALVSERCYKKGYSHDTAMEMIMDGQCGKFNPMLLNCLRDIEDELRNGLQSTPDLISAQQLTQALPLQRLTSEILHGVRHADKKAISAGLV